MLEIKFTMPEQVILIQEDSPEVDRWPKDDDEDDDEERKQPEMFFIAKGKFGVSIKKNHGVSVIRYTSDKKDKPDRVLQDGDHFGEISMIYNCKRTATVESCNYGTLAALRKENFLEL